jgi:3-oxoacyl-[acyl-carrier protein] reductase
MLMAAVYPRVSRRARSARLGRRGEGSPIVTAHGGAQGDQPMDLQLKGKSCLVTGASRGIGRGTAKVLAAEGCRVAILARRANLLDELAREIEGAGGTRPLIVAEDLTAAGAPERVRERVLAELGGLDVLVNNAGSSRPVKWNASEEQWLEGMTLNFELVRRLTNQFVPTMRAQKWGRIINITGANEPPGVNIASVAKAALHNWAKGLSRELAPDGITINCLPPGRINSEQILGRLHPTAENRKAFIDANIPIGFFGEPEDMGYLVAFLASPLARYITGEVIHVDGGMHRFAG